MTRAGSSKATQSPVDPPFISKAETAPRKCEQEMRSFRRRKTTRLEPLPLALLHLAMEMALEQAGILVGYVPRHEIPRAPFVPREI